MPWFPITDPDRAVDIRMRRRRALLLLSSVVFVPWILWGDRHATHAPATTHARIVLPTIGRLRSNNTGAETRRISAAALRIDLPCAGEVTVLPDPSLSGQAILSASGRALAAMRIADGAVTDGGACLDDAVTIRTGNAMPLQLIETGDNDMRVGHFDGAVTITSSGGGTVTLDHAGSLVVRGTNSGDVTVGSVTGPLTAIMSGSGDLRVGSGTIPVLDAVSEGSADLLLDQVRVLGGRIRLEGSGDAHLAGTSGTFEASTSGTGDILIHQVENDRLALVGLGSGDIRIGGGRITTLDARLGGSGDLVIDAKIENGRLEQTGSGDVRIPNGDALVRTDR